MQRRDSLGLTTKIPRLSKGSTRKFKLGVANLRLAALLTFLLTTNRLKEEVERTEEASERSEVEPREEVLFRGMSKSEIKSHKWRHELHIQPVPTHLWSS